MVRVLDGDSLRIQRGGRVYEIRLYGIDTPEYRQPYSNKAKKMTSRLAYRQLVSVEEKDIDRYGRVVALVVSKGLLLNRELVKEGLAWYYPSYCRSQPLCNELRQLEEHARQERRGLWKDEHSVAPWDWKKEQRQSGSKELSKWYYRFSKEL